MQPAPAEPVRAGTSAVELLIGLAVMAVLAMGAVADLVQWRQRWRLEGTVRGLALTAAALRTRAAASGSHHGLWFRGEGERLEWVVVADGDGNGLRTEQLRTGQDVQLGGWVRLATEAPGIRGGLPAGLPGLDGRWHEALVLGGTDILSLGPDGTATSGTLYLSDAQGNAAALRVYGPTGRLSLWRRRRETGQWALFR